MTAMLVFARLATAGGESGPVLHEPILPDPVEDLAMRALLPGNVPAAILTQKGPVSAPDLQSPPPESSLTYAGDTSDRFRADRDTRRPSASMYDDPFTPRTAPYKRLSAFDAIRSDYSLGVRDERQNPLALGLDAGSGPDADDDFFYGDLLVDATTGHRVRIPSVGPGTRIAHAYLSGAGAEEIPFQIFRDGADNWFLQASGGSSSSAQHARLIMELAIPRQALGGPFHAAAWSELPLVTPLPDAVARDAAVVRSAIGVSRAMRPREAVARLVQYFRTFVDSDEPPQGRGSIYLDLALSKKGVCRHRAFAFVITAQSLGIPSRMVVNEAHAWVEVHDGTLYRRIDLGGAGSLEAEPRATRPEYETAGDPFAWPPGSTPGRDRVGEGRPAPSARDDPGAAQSSTGRPERPDGGAAWGPARPIRATDDTAGMQTLSELERPARAAVHLEAAESSPHRGDSLRLRGKVTADGETCGQSTVDLWLTPAGAGDDRPIIVLGSLATDDQGAFDGALTLPSDAPLGDYDVAAKATVAGGCK